MGKHLLASVLGVALLSPIAAQAMTAYAGKDITLHAGPGATYPTVEQLSQDTRLWLLGCTRQGEWCDVSHGRIRGWVRLGQIALSDGFRISDAIPVASFNLDDYWSEHYRHEPFYDNRDRWRGTSRRQVAESTP
jgi:uncharacterized protein YraI